jgi:inward rectifier potassium channel
VVEGHQRTVDGQHRSAIGSASIRAALGERIAADSTRLLSRAVRESIAAVAAPQTIKPKGAEYEIRVIGARPTPLRDFYHALLRSSWAVTFAVIAAAFLGMNAIFAFGYWTIGGIAHARPGSIVDAFFFSVQTMGTIGYGAMYPESRAANTLVVFEALVGIILTALATGLVFAKFSRPTARVVFSREATISPMNGVPTLTFRIGNQRGNAIVDALIRVSMVRTERTGEGQTFYRMLDLTLTRERALSLSRSWTVLHTIDEKSPFWGATPETLVRDEVELQVLVIGIDDTTMHPIQASHQYYSHDILWGARHADVLTESEDGALLLDVDKFHDVEPTAATPDFPYSQEDKA